MIERGKGKVVILKFWHNLALPATGLAQIGVHAQQVVRKPEPALKLQTAKAEFRHPSLRKVAHPKIIHIYVIPTAMHKHALIILVIN
ncbi:hypothetical protein A2Y83_04285 [Candidatus Falkowbacteria bacterium RBG_13_39_14]|uniref:Uncharacterized protein n=1 Tax=Candidatus Falkowbacteria bacterium RBG_13_39_14 TaxID=1797985 RepID=A0A1F5S7N4_9BACT|nr:MAG: hypothetical protein A2Y83_04285 [Candidatus Falkowbacteria bacterium RBG_13_39_14]